MKCPNCGMTLRPDDKTCFVCGTPVNTPVDTEQTMRAEGEKDRRYPREDYESDYAYRRHEAAGSNDKEPQRPRYDENDYRRESPRPRGYDAENYRREPPRRSGSEREAQKQKSPKKALIISIIALVLVIALTGGVIFFVSRDTVSAKELQDAKDKFLPPAQAVTIDTSGDDPSNDDIQFRYDDRARILSCTYKANGKPYDQRYTYDDAAKKVDIETLYKDHPIFTKEIPYSRVTAPNIFADIDGYYIRLGDEYFDAPATEAPTDAPTEQPTEAPTEESTEEPTDPPKDWRDLYLDYLNSADTEFASGRLVYLNDDDTPELFLEYKTPIALAHFELCWIDNETVQHERVVESIPKYQERSGYMLTSSEGKVWALVQFDGTSLNTAKSGSNYGSEYKINGEEVSKEEYEAAVSEFSDWDLMYDFNSMAKIDALPDYIRNFE